MIGEAQVTIRNVGLLLGQRGLFVAGTFVFAVVVPRLMGPENFGRYALVTSLSIWFVLLGDLGFTQVMARYIPRFTFDEDKATLQKFFGSLVAVSLLSGIISAGLYFVVTRFWVGDFGPSLLAIMAGTVMVRALARPFFTLFLGLNQAARWGMSEVLTRWVSVILLIPGFYFGGLAGACLALLLTDLVVLGFGLHWGRAYLSWSEVRLDVPYLKPYLRFGLIFFIVSLLMTAFEHSGEVLVRFFYDNYVQVGHFALAYSVYLTASTAIPRFTLPFAPLMTTLLAKGEDESLRQWIEHLLKWLAVGGVLLIFGVLLLGNDLVPVVLGNAFQPVAANLVPLSVAFLFQALSNVATLVTLILDRPKIALSAAGVRLAAFWGLGPLLVGWAGSFGGCLAVSLASAVYAAYFTWRMRGVIPYSLRKWAAAVCLGGLFLPLLWLRSTLPVNIALYVVFVIGYGGMLFFRRVISGNEVAALKQAISPLLSPYKGDWLG